MTEASTVRLPAVYRTTGAGEIDVRFPEDAGGDRQGASGPGPAFKLLYLRVHFAGAASTADLVISLDSSAGEEFDVQLFAVKARGVGADCNLVLTAAERIDPSPWAFQSGDALRITWANPGGVTWGLELGYQEF